MISREAVVRIINISSVMKTGQCRDITSICISKGADAMLTRNASVRTAKVSKTFCCRRWAWRLLQTPIMRHTLEDPQEFSRLNQYNPIVGVAEPGEIARM